MQLYYTPGACSMAPHIMAREAGVPVDLVKVALPAHTLEDGSDYYAVNPLGYVPMLVFDDGSKHTEAAFLTQYLAERGELGPRSEAERLRLMETMNFLSTELHKGFGPLFGKDAPEAMKAQARDKLAKRFAMLDSKLDGQEFLVGDRFTAADAYAFVMLTWADKLGIDLADRPHLAAFKSRIAARPKVREAMAAEGLLQ